MKDSNEKKRTKALPIIISLLIASVIVCAGAVGSFFALVPQKAARYTLRNCDLEYVFEMPTSASDAAGVRTGLKDLEKDSFSERLSDFWLVIKTAVLSPGTDAIVCVEAGENITDSLFLQDGEAYVFGDLSEIPTNDIGYYIVKTQVNGKSAERLLIVCDSIVPMPFNGENFNLWVGEPPSPDLFIYNSLSDATLMSGKYVVEPDCSAPGRCSYEIEVRDRGGNLVCIYGTKFVFEDTEPPVISGAADRTVTIGETVMYKEGVTVTDNRDGENIELQVDISSVDPQQPGTYPVVFSATDTTGLCASVTVYFTFEYSEEDLLQIQLEEKIQPILNAIIKEGMTEREKARAIYNWVHGKIKYTGTSDKSSWQKAALKGLKNRSGDCFTYFSISKVLLTAAGIENLDVQRLPSSHHPNTTHWWNMVYVDGCWWHFDTTRRADGTTFFLVTTSQLLEYSNAHNYSHDFDPEQFPKTP